MDERFKALAADIISVDDRTVEHWITREVTDRDSEIVISDGMDAAEFMLNPVVLWAHERWTPPIGKALDGSLSITPQQGVSARTEFAKGPLASEILDLYKGGFMRAWSIGFSVQQMEGNVISAWSLREYSAVPVPSNPLALVKAAEAGSDLAPRLLSLYYPQEKDAVEAGRVAGDVRRVLGGLESLRNHARHCAKANEPFAVAEQLKAAESYLTELGVIKTPDTAVPQADAAPDGDLPDEVAAELLTLVSGLRAQMRERSDQADRVRAARRALIGGRTPQ